MFSYKVYQVQQPITVCRRHHERGHRRHPLCRSPDRGPLTHEFQRAKDTGPELHRELGACSLFLKPCTLAFSARCERGTLAGLRA